MHRSWLLVALLAVAVWLGAGCGGDDSDPEDADSAPAAEGAPAPDLNHYCELVAQLSRAGEELFAEVESDPNAAAEEFEAAELELVETQAETLTDLQSVAPSEISADVELVVRSLRARAGLEEQAPSGAGEAEKRVRAFEKRNC